MQISVKLLIAISILSYSCIRSGSTSGNHTNALNSEDSIGALLSADNQQGETIEIVRYDSLLIATIDSIYVSVVVERVHYSNAPNCEYCESSDVSLKIKDQYNKVRYSHTIEKDFDDWSTLTPSSIYLEGIGNVIVITEQTYPNLAEDLGRATVLGQNHSGYIIPMTGDIPITALFDGNRMFKVHRHKADENDYFLETLNHSRWCDIYTGAFYQFCFQGDCDPNQATFFDSAPLYWDKSNDVMFNKQMQSSIGSEFVLYESTDLSSDYTVMTIGANSEIHFYSIDRVGYEEYVKIQIDGVIGYIYGLSSNLDKLGFVPCG
jgi:hypothetical protein